jgi:D-glycero-alpha-D-manno-heptose-7-phosphate kinase
LLLYFTGQSRESARIIDSQIAGSKDPSGTTIAALMEIKRAATEMKDALLVGEVSTVLRILGSSWESKKKAAAAITNSHIDMLAQTATAAGATAVKISGAGGGGFMMIAAEPSDRYSVIRSLQDLGGRFFAFSFVFEGTQSWKRSLNQSWPASARQSLSSRRS